MNWPEVAMHGELLTDGNVLTWGDSSQGDTAYVWNPTTNTFTSLPDAFANPSCGGNNILPDGRVIAVGGGGVNSADANTNVTGFQETNQAWAQLGSNAFPTWYASTTVLPNGNLLRLGGVDGCNNCNPEVPEEFSPATNQWTTLSNNPTLLPMYPFIYVRPDGTVAVTGSTLIKAPLMIYDPTTETWTTSDPNVVDGGSSAMYDTGKVIKAGSSYNATVTGNSAPSAATAYITDLSQATPTWTQTGSMAFPRSYLNLTTLPDGTVLATGGGTTQDGSNLSGGVLPAEDWNPATGQWTTWASMAVPRLYHSIGLLLPSGQVLVAGTGDLNGSVPNELNAQIFSPPYLFNGPRPTITSSPSVVQYGSNFQVSTPDAASITSVSLIRPAAVTHSFNQSSRRVSLSFTASNGTLNVQAPANGGDAPPGPYMLFIVNSNGVPSVASWVNLPAPYQEDTPPSAPSGLTGTATGPSSVSLSWTASTDNIGVTGYNIFRNGTKIGTSTTTSYTDNSVASSTTYTYTVTAYDAAGQVSTPSNSATVATAGSTAPGAPTGVTAVPGDGSATVSWTAPSNGGSAITSYTVTPYIGSAAQTPVTVSGSPATVTGLTNGTAYTFTVSATNAAGTGPASAPSNAVTPSTPPAVTSVTPASGATGVAASVAPTATFSQAVTPGTVSFTVKDSGGNSVAGTVSFNSGDTVATFTPGSPLAAGVTYTATVSGAQNASGTPMSSPFSWNFTTVGPTCPCSIWQNGTPTGAAESGTTNAQTVGLKFQASSDGYITAVRFYKEPDNTGAHTGSLWSSTGTLLANGTFSNETASGWQELDFSPPVAITAGTTYVASYFTTTGHPAYTDQGLASAVVTGPLTALAAGGVYAAAPANTFPTSVFDNTNYWVDVVYSPAAGATAPVVSTVSPANGSTGNAVSVAPTATFSQAVKPSTVSFTVKNSAGKNVPGTVSFNSADTVATFTPGSPLAASITYTATVSGAQNASGTPMKSPYSWSFTTAATAPGAPTGVTATSGNGSAVVSWTAPSNGGSAITRYTVTPYIGSAAQTPVTVSGSPPAASATVTGLTNGTAYTFTVSATNAAGTGPASAPSNAVTPSVPPVVSTVSPANGSTGNAVSVAPTATFSQAVTPGTVSFTMKNSRGKSVAGTVSFNSAHTVATFTPASPLAASTTYTATVSGAQNASGTPMSSPFSWSFTTR
jgi:hypothetical protein